MSILDSIPDISFIGDISVEKLKEIGINEYKSALSEITGETVTQISDEDKATFMKIISSMDKNDSSAMIKSILDMPRSIQRLLLPESTINKKKITTDDKVIFLKEMNGITKKSSAKDIYAKLDTK